jgi:hypothetical protein
METTVTFTTDELNMLVAATANYAKSLRSVAARIGPVAREHRDERVARANVATEFEARIRKIAIDAMPLPGLKKGR